MFQRGLLCFHQRADTDIAAEAASLIADANYDQTVVLNTKATMETRFLAVLITDLGSEQVVLVVEQIKMRRWLRCGIPRIAVYYYRRLPGNCGCKYLFTQYTTYCPAG